MASASRSPRASSAPRTVRAGDIARQVAVIAALGFALTGVLVSNGLLGGTPARDVQQGALDADGSFLAPGRPAFGIWGVIYAGLVAYAVWQALPSQREAARQRVLGWWIALTIVLNGVWLVTAQVGQLWTTVAAIVLLLAVLGYTFRLAVVTKQTQSPWLDSALIDGVTGLHLGWVSVATVANVAALLTAIGPDPWEIAATQWAIAVLVAVLVIGLATAWASGWRIAPALATAWGCLWIGLERLMGEPYSVATAVTALIVAAILVVVPGGLRLVSLLRQSGD